MKIYDISQELLSCAVYDGDPKPCVKAINRIDSGDLYNLSSIFACAHNGTHVDAPFHFINDGMAVDKIPLQSLVGNCYVHSHNGNFGEEDATRALKLAKSFGVFAEKRILLKGDATVTTEGARALSNAGILLIGVESQSVGPVESPMAVHLELLKKDIVLLEGIRLQGLEDGVYFLCAAPLKIAGLDGAPCRAILIDKEN